MLWLSERASKELEEVTYTISLSGEENLPPHRFCSVKYVNCGLRKQIIMTERLRVEFPSHYTDTTNDYRWQCADRMQALTEGKEGSLCSCLEEPNTGTLQTMGTAAQRGSKWHFCHLQWAARGLTSLFVSLGWTNLACKEASPADSGRKHCGKP